MTNYLHTAEEVSVMAVPTAGSVRDASRQPAPAITGLADLLDVQVRERPGGTALVVRGDRMPLSYAALAAAVDDVASRLRSTGLRSGDAVALVAADSTEFVVALLGAARAGLVAAPIDPALSSSRVHALLEALGARAVLVGPPAAGRGPIAQVDVPAWSLRVDVSRAGTATVALDTAAPALPPAGGAAHGLTSEDALVLCTVGTTDGTRMVPLTHANVAASVRGICAAYELGPDDATVAVMPLFHSHGLFAALLATLASGGCVLLPGRGRFSVHTFWDDVQAVSATWFTAVSTIHEVLLERAASEYPGRHHVPLRFVRSSGAPLNSATQRALERTLGAPLLSAYGMTETSHQAASEPLPQHGPLKHRSVGLPAGVDVRIVDRQGRTCPAGTVGEVWVRGSVVARGYLGDPAETERSFADGWFRTGDLGSLDDDGYLFLTGRMKNVIHRGGEAISPEYVEDVIAGCPGVVEAAVFAIPDVTHGQRVGAAVVVSDGECIGPGQILEYSRSRLSSPDVPDRLDIVDSLPHTATGGLDRRAVQARYAR